MLIPYPVAGLAIALAGADKLLTDHGYERMFHRLGLSDTDMQKVGGAELLGGLLMMLRPTRRLGAAIVLAASSTVLGAELESGDAKLAGSRAGVMLAALGALAFPG